VTGFRHVPRAAARKRAREDARQKDVPGLNKSEDVPCESRTDVGAGGIGVGIIDARQRAVQGLSHTSTILDSAADRCLEPLWSLDTRHYDLVGKALRLRPGNPRRLGSRVGSVTTAASIFLTTYWPEHEGRTGVPRLLHEVETELEARAQGVNRARSARG